MKTQRDARDIREAVRERRATKVEQWIEFTYRQIGMILTLAHHKWLTFQQCQIQNGSGKRSFQRHIGRLNATAEAEGFKIDSL